MRGLKRLALVAIVIVACARIAPPPGGPLRLIPPKLVGVFPDSGIAPCDFRGVAEFRFDEVTDEGTTANFGYGNGTLEQLVILSPDTLVPTVEWHRDRITVKPRGGWRPNRTYRVELLPGVRDLRQNITKSGRTISFTTCGPPPTRALSGRAVDWTTGRAIPSALIEAYHLPDSLPYRTIADSTGRFRMTGVPAGPYLVVATLHPDRTHRRDPFREPWDSVRVDATRDTVGEIWAFPRDTLPPRVTDATRQDSQSILLTFNKPLDPTQRIDSMAMRVRLLVGSDSFNVGTVYAYPQAMYDSLMRLSAPPRPKLDSAGRLDSLRKDSVTRANQRAAALSGRPVRPLDLPLQKRPRLGTTLVIRTFGKVDADKRYAIDITGVRSVAGRVSAHLFQVLTPPKPPTAAEIARAKADTARAKVRADSIAKADSIKRATKPDSVNLFQRR